MKPEWSAQWAWDEAKAASHEYLRDARVGMAVKMTAQPYPLYEHFARALLDAHQRGRREGMEEAAKVADSRCNQWSNSRDHDVVIQESARENEAEHIAAAIRAKMEDQP